MSRKEKSRYDKKRAPEGASILTSVFIMVMAVVSLVIVYHLDWIRYDGSGRSVHTFIEDSEVAVYLEFTLILIILVLIAGAVIGISVFLKKIEAVPPQRAMWINYITFVLLIMPLSLMLFLKLRYLGFYIAAIHLSLQGAELYDWFPAPFALAGISALLILFTFRFSRDEMKCILFNRNYKKGGKNKRVTKIPRGESA